MFRFPIAPRSLRAFAPSLFIALLVGPTTVASGATDIPLDAPQDAIMAGPAEIQEMQHWASVAFTGERPSGREPAVRVELRRQHYNSLGFGQSCMETPVCWGSASSSTGWAPMPTARSSCISCGREGIQGLHRIW